MDIEKAIETFGFDPTTIGLRHRAWWVVEEIKDEEKLGMAQVGDLAVRARDGGSNPPDMFAGIYPNFRGTSCDFFDCTYRYYYYAPLRDAYSECTEKRYMQTPFGPLPVRKHIADRLASMTDLEVADETFKSQPGLINPEAFAELVARRLCFRGDFEKDVYRRIEKNE